MRRVLCALVVAASVGAASAAGSGRTPAIVFAADRAPSVTGEIYRIGLGGRLVDLSRNPFMDTHPLVSPDGRQVAFLSDRGVVGESFRVWTVGIDGRGVRPASGVLSAGQWPQLAWAPDSRRLAVVVQISQSPFRMGLYVVQLGRAQRLVFRAETIVDPGWSADGHVVTVRGVGKVIALSPAGAQLWSVFGDRYAWSSGGTIAVSGAGVIRTYAERGARLASFRGRSFAWSPHGERLAVVTRKGLELRAPRGRLLFRRAIAGLEAGQYNLLDWIGGHRVVVGGVAGADGAEHSVEVDLLIGRIRVLKPRYYQVRSRDGSRVVAVESGALVVSGRTLARSKSCYDDGALTGFADVQFTPDGRSIVYQSYCPEAFDNLYAVGADGSGLRRLTDVAAQQTGPSWSPDGTRIAYVQSRFTGLSCKGCPSSLWVANADASHARRLTNPPDCTYDSSPAWSPDGKTILFSRASCYAPARLLAIPAAGGSLRDLHVSGSQPAWGPLRIAFVDDTTLWTAAPDGSDRRRVASGSPISPAWSHLGELAYLARSPGLVTLVVGRNRIRLPFTDARSLAWSPDGERLVVTAHASGAAAFDLYTLRADGTDLRRLTQNVGAASATWLGR
jgi:Tol biopolymer transport system component